MQPAANSIPLRRSKCTHPTRWFLRKYIQPIVLPKVTLVTAMMAALTGCCQPNDPSCRNVSLGASGAEVAGIAIAAGGVIATVVAVEVHHAHHTINGCASNGPGGMQLQAHGKPKTYLLSGNTVNISAGEHIRLRGTKVGPPRHINTDPTFLVDRKIKITDLAR